MQEAEVAKAKGNSDNPLAQLKELGSIRLMLILRIPRLQNIAPRLHLQPKLLGSNGPGEFIGAEHLPAGPKRVRPGLPVFMIGFVMQATW